MKKLFSILVVAVVVFSFSSCTEDCEKNNTGEVEIYNRTETNLYFDVTGSNEATYEQREVVAASSTRYKEVPAGEIKILGSFTNEKKDFIVLDNRILKQCGSESYTTATESCQLFNVSDITVNNYDDYPWVIDVFVSTDAHGNGFYLGEKHLASGQNHTYKNVDVGFGLIAFGIYLGAGIGWYWDGWYVFKVCEPVTYTWTYKKSDGVASADKSSDKMNMDVFK